jgi:hypothetical protein
MAKKAIMPALREGWGMKPTTELFLAQADQLVADINPLFVGKPPAVLGLALAELVAAHIAGAHPDLRAKARDEFLSFVDEMISEYAKQIFPDGLPPEWRR